MITKCIYCGGRVYKSGQIGIEWYGRSCPVCHILWTNLHGLRIRSNRRWKDIWEQPEGLLIVANERPEAKIIGRKK